MAQKELCAGTNPTPSQVSVMLSLSLICIFRSLWWIRACWTKWPVLCFLFITLDGLVHNGGSCLYNKHRDSNLGVYWRNQEMSDGTIAHMLDHSSLSISHHDNWARTDLYSLFLHKIHLIILPQTCGFKARVLHHLLRRIRASNFKFFPSTTPTHSSKSPISGKTPTPALDLWP